jgi:hypothetical protein
MESAQFAILHHQDPAIAGSIQVFARNTLDDSGTVGGPKPRGHREGIAVEIGIVGDLHQGISVAEAERRAGTRLSMEAGGTEPAQEQNQAAGNNPEAPKATSLGFDFDNVPPMPKWLGQLHGLSQFMPNHRPSPIRSKKLKYKFS